MFGDCWSRKPSLHVLRLQVTRQSSSLLELPSSHSSVRRLTLPSPHLVSLQVDRQSSPSSKLPSSRSSSASTTPFSHPLLMQARSNGSQLYPSGHQPSPHAMPSGGRHAASPTLAAIRSPIITARWIGLFIRRSSCPYFCT